MRVLLTKLTYANVIATLALFLALGGGAVWAAGQLGKNAVKSQNIAPKAVKSTKIAANAVKNKNLSKNAVTRSKVKAGTLAGLQVTEVQATNVPGFTTDVPPGSQGTPVSLTGTPTFTPKTGKSYALLAELRGNPIDADGPSGKKYGGPGCYASARIDLNGEPASSVYISANADQLPPYDVNPIGTEMTAVGLLTAGQAQTIAANAFGSSTCGAGTTGNLRIVVIELG